MEPHIAEDIAKQEKQHWWFYARRAMAYTLLRGITLAPSPIILDAGCGAGGNLHMLNTFGDVFAMEPDEQLLAHARRRKIGHVEYGALPGEIPFPELTFDLVTLFDVLEHIEDDAAALQALAERMSPKAVLCINVPAHQWLFSQQDRTHHHHRRYSKKQLSKLLVDNGFTLHWMTYWNCLLFPVAAMLRLYERGSAKPYAIGTQMPSPYLNNILKKIVSAERHLAPHMPLPFGLSIMVLARKVA